MPRITISRRTALAGLAAGALCVGAFSTAAPASAADTIRVGLPTKTYWPTTVAEAAVRQGLFEKEGLTAELTIYRGGAEAFEALAAGAADIILDPPALVAVGRTRGVPATMVASGSQGYFGWKLMVPADSDLGIDGLAGKQVGITSAGSASDLLALWTGQDKGVEFTRVPVGGGGLVPNLLSGNIDAAVVYSPLSFQIEMSGEAKVLLTYADEVPRHINSGWIVRDDMIAEKPELVQKAVNALYGGLDYLRNNREAAITLISELNDIPTEVAEQEYEQTILQLDTGEPMTEEAIQKALDLAELSGMSGFPPAGEVFSNQFKPAPTQP